MTINKIYIKYNKYKDDSHSSQFEIIYLYVISLNFFE